MLKYPMIAHEGLFLRCYKYFIIFQFNKDLTVKFAPPFLVMTSSYEAVISVTGIFFKNASIGYELKLTKFQRLSESRLGVILKNSMGVI